MTPPTPRFQPLADALAEVDAVRLHQVIVAAGPHGLKALAVLVSAIGWLLARRGTALGASVILAQLPAALARAEALHRAPEGQG